MKKRLMSFIWAFAVVIAGQFILEAEPVYAASTKISSVEDLLAMEENPSGDYYLANDITVPENTCLFADGIPFTGTLDGKGHKLNGYKSTEASAIFDSARLAEFKNLSVTNVDIKVQGSAAALVYNADNCFFKNIKVSGTIVSSGDGGDVGGIVACGSGSMEKCKNSARITAQTQKSGKAVGGLAGSFTAASLEDCSNSGTVTLSTGTDQYVLTPDTDGHGWRCRFSVAGLVAGQSDYVTSCKNSGNVTLNLKYSVDEKNSDDATILYNDTYVYVSGICNAITGAITSSGNTGKIKVISDKSTKVYDGPVYVAGVAGAAVVSAVSIDNRVTASKCYNTGAVSFSGTVRNSDWTDDFDIGGLFGVSDTVSQCYNKGKVSAACSLTEDDWYRGYRIGGIAGEVRNKINNSYNTGNVTVTNTGKKKGSTFMVGGLLGFLNHFGADKKAYSTCNYSTGMVKCKNLDNRYRGLLVGSWEEIGNNTRYRYIYNNYYTRSGKAYGAGDTTRKDIKPKATKVSSITAKKCSKLSSKYWKYSSKRKRMILKNNPEK